MEIWEDFKLLFLFYWLFFIVHISVCIFIFLIGLRLFYKPSLWECFSFYHLPETFAIKFLYFFYAVCKEHAFHFLYSMEASRDFQLYSGLPEDSYFEINP